MGYKHLTYTARLQIEAWDKAEVPAKVMAEKLGVDTSTIYRELKRGAYTHLNTDYTTDTRYSADIAQKKYEEHLTAKGTGLKIGNDHEFAAYIEYKISVERYSPGAVLGEIKQKGLKFNTTISKTTLYRYINDGVFLTISNADLPIKKNKGKKKKDEEKRGSRAPKGTSIDNARKASTGVKISGIGKWIRLRVKRKQRKRFSLLQSERVGMSSSALCLPRHLKVSSNNSTKSKDRSAPRNLSRYSSQSQLIMVRSLWMSTESRGACLQAKSALRFIDAIRTVPTKEAQTKTRIECFDDGSKKEQTLQMSRRRKSKKSRIGLIITHEKCLDFAPPQMSLRRG